MANNISSTTKTFATATDLETYLHEVSPVLEASLVTKDQGIWHLVMWYQSSVASAIL